MKLLKGYVKNHARPEGCIAERYSAEECVRFCSGYMEKAGIIGIRHDRNEDLPDERILFGGRPFTAGVPIILSEAQLHSAHHYVLHNCAEVLPYIE